MQRTLVFRHGQSKYEEGNRICSPKELETIRDMDMDGIYAIIKNIIRVIPLLDPKEEVLLVTSPLPRTLHATRIIRDFLQERDFIVNVELEEEICEVKNFDWTLFYPLFAGGSLLWQGRKLTVNKGLTNPLGFDYAKYFNYDVLHGLSNDAVASLPESYLERIRSFEKSKDVTARVVRFFKKHMKRQESQSIVVTHDASVGFIVRQATGHKRSGITPGNFLILERKGTKTIVVEIEGKPCTAEDLFAGA